jgi:hypothetical protein
MTIERRMWGTATWAHCISREGQSQLVSDAGGTVIAAPFTISGVNIDAWHRRVLSHRGDAELGAAGLRSTLG